MISATEEVEAAANDLVGQYEEVDVVDDVMHATTKTVFSIGWERISGIG
jgi:hypothetical protein